MKCLPKEKLPLAKGSVLHDWHAEVLAIRAFNRWVLDECLELAGKGREDEEGQWVRRRRKRIRLDDERADQGGHENDSQQEVVYQDAVQAPRPEHDPPFELHPDIRIHMYISEAPCGDASMELTMSAQEDSTPWTDNPPMDELLGRGNFDRLGVVRRKPARPDAPVCWSKSCSDKLAMKQCTGLLSGIMSLVVHPGRCYLETLVLPKSQYVAESVERAFGKSGRMSQLFDAADKRWQGRWAEAGYSFQPFEVRTTSREFEYSKRVAPASPADENAGERQFAASNLSAMWTPSNREEILINGVLQGRKQFDPRGASCVSRMRMWEDVVRLATLVGDGRLGADSKEDTYGKVKQSELLRARDGVKSDVRDSALKGWKKNSGDEEWSLDD
jgi:tRNA-specific adenosine deaminase 1